MEKTKLWKIKLFEEKKMKLTEKEKQQIRNYGKLFWFDSQEYRNDARLAGIEVWQCLYSQSKNQKFIPSKDLKIWWENNSVDGDVLDVINESLNYEDSVNALLFGYVSDLWKNIKANKHLENLDKPTSTYCLTRDIIKTWLRKNKKQKYKEYEKSDYIKSLARTPLDVVNSLIIQENNYIIEQLKELEQLQEKYKKNRWWIKQKIDRKKTQLEQIIM